MIASAGRRSAVRDVNVLGEWNDAEDGIDVYDRDAVLTVDNEANDLDALHDAGEIIESSPKRCCAPVRVGREFAHGI